MKYIPKQMHRAAIEFLLQHPRAGLAASPGLGKTAVVETVIKQLLEKRPEKRVLIVVTKKILVSEGWQREAEKWDHLSGLKVVPISGTPANRKRILDHLPQVSVVNYELIPWLLEQTFDRWPWDLVVCDESHKLKKYNGSWFGGKPRKRDHQGNLVPAKPGLRHVAGRTARWINLTGTLSPNSIQDVWSQTALLDGGARLGPNITAFRNRWMHQGRDGFSWQANPGAAEAVGRLLSDTWLSLQAKDFLDLPPVIYNTVPVPLEPNHSKAYRFLEDEFFLRLTQGEVIEAANAAVLSGKLMQFCQGFLYDDAAGWTDIHNAKLDALADLLEEIDRPVIVAYQFKADLARLQARFPQAVHFTGSPETIRAFGAGEIPILLIHPGSAAEGVEGLQAGTDTLIFYCMTWNAGQHDQVIERIGPTRQLQAGHPRPVTIHYLAVQNSVDLLAIKRVRDKLTVQEILTQAAKGRP